MVNVTILNKKDILKYGIKLGIVLVCLFMFIEIIKQSNQKEEIKLQGILSKDRLESCLEETIPIMKQVNGNMEDFGEKIEGINLLDYTVSKQLAMLNEIRPKENKTENQEIKEENNDIVVEQAKTGLETKVVENNVPTKFTNEYNGVKVRNET